MTPLDGATRASHLTLAPDDRLSDLSARDLLVEVAHDLRSPLSAILMMADALRRGQAGPVNSDQDRQLGIICRAALSLCATAADVVEYARSDNSRAGEVPFSVHAALESVRDTVAPMLGDRAVELRFDLDAVDCRLGHGSAFSRVMLNLVTNALKHTERGVVEVRVRECETNPDRLECSVSDTGRGMAPTVLRAVFGSGFDSGQSRGLTSAGVGLAICRRLVASMGATLHAESIVGVGTRFHFALDLPRIAAAVA
jgi:signal transduction histidine kinase